MPSRLQGDMQITCDRCGAGCSDFPRFQRSNENYDLCKSCFDAVVSAQPAVRFEFTVYPFEIQVAHAGFGSMMRVIETPTPRLRVELNFDGACQPNPGVGGGGFVIKGFQETIRACTPFGSLETSNSAEYKSLLFGLRAVSLLAERAGVPLSEVEVEVRGDSQLIICQMRGEYDVNDPDLQVLHALATCSSNRFQRANYGQVPREQNAEADALAKQALTARFNENAFANFRTSLSAHTMTAVHGIGWSRPVRASTDLGLETARRAPEEGGPPLFLVDAAFVASLPTFEGGLIRVPPMQRALKDVKPHPTLRVLRANGATMSVLGVTELELGPRQGNTFKATALVIHKLPVPLHIGRSELPELQSRTKSVGGFGPNLFPHSYRAHPFWASASARPSSARARDPPAHAFAGLAIHHNDG